MITEKTLSEKALRRSKVAFRSATSMRPTVLSN
jgi:hypothetical protein